MNYPVIWLSEAEITFKQNLEYLKAEWPESVRAEFISRVEKTIKVISESPGQYPFYRKNDQVRKCVLHQRITLYFKVKNEKIYLITFWNSYRDPKKVKI